MIKYKITASSIPSCPQAYYKILNCNNGGVEKVPGGLSTGITYLLPKSGDSKEVRNY